MKQIKNVVCDCVKYPKVKCICSKFPPTKRKFFLATVLVLCKSMVYTCCTCKVMWDYSVESFIFWRFIKATNFVTLFWYELTTKLSKLIYIAGKRKSNVDFSLKKYERMTIIYHILSLILYANILNPKIMWWKGFTFIYQIEFDFSKLLHCAQMHQSFKMVVWNRLSTFHNNFTQGS